MPQETEIKLRIHDLKAFRRRLTATGAKPVGKDGGQVHELNVLFDTPAGGLAKHGQLLRIRTETPSRSSGKGLRPKPSRVLVTFKRPTPDQLRAGDDWGHGRHKVREEIEAEVPDSAGLTRIFEGLGMAGWFRYEKFRTTFRLPSSKDWAKGLLIELDETPIGTFVELEGPADAIDRAAQDLGFPKKDYIVKNYLTLYVEECRKRGEQPRNMLFPPAASPKDDSAKKKHRRKSISA
jgi:adenylate cyclase, class 2